MEQSGADWNVNKTEQQYFGWRKWNKFKVTIPVMFILRVILQVPLLKKTEKNVANIDYSQRSSKSSEFKLIHREYELLVVRH